MKAQKTHYSQHILKKENKAMGITLPGFKLYYKVTITQTVWFYHKDKLIDKWSRIENPEINLCIYNQLILYKGIKNAQQRKGNSSINDARKTGYSHAKG